MYPNKDNQIQFYFLFNKHTCWHGSAGKGAYTKSDNPSSLSRKSEKMLSLSSDCHMCIVAMSSPVHQSIKGMQARVCMMCDSDQITLLSASSWMSRTSTYFLHGLIHNTINIIFIWKIILHVNLEFSCFHLEVLCFSPKDKKMLNTKNHVIF